MFVLIKKNNFSKYKFPLQTISLQNKYLFISCDISSRVAVSNISFTFDSYDIDIIFFCQNLTKENTNIESYLFG